MVYIKISLTYANNMNVDTLFIILLLLCWHNTCLPMYSSFLVVSSQWYWPCRVYRCTHRFLSFAHSDIGRVVSTDVQLVSCRLLTVILAVSTDVQLVSCRLLTLIVYDKQTPSTHIFVNNHQNVFCSTVDVNKLHVIVYINEYHLVF